VEFATTTATERRGRWSVAAPAKAWIYGWLCRRICDVGPPRIHGVGPHLVGRPPHPVGRSPPAAPVAPNKPACPEGTGLPLRSDGQLFSHGSHATTPSAIAEARSLFIEVLSPTNIRFPGSVKAPVDTRRDFRWSLYLGRPVAEGHESIGNAELQVLIFLGSAVTPSILCRRRNLAIRFVIRNTGHGFLGRSVG
jgi:hypothetical protein